MVSGKPNRTRFPISVTMGQDSIAALDAFASILGWNRTIALETMLGRYARLVTEAGMPEMSDEDIDLLCETVGGAAAVDATDASATLKKALRDSIHAIDEVLEAAEGRPSGFFEDDTPEIRSRFMTDSRRRLEDLERILAAVVSLGPLDRMALLATVETALARSPTRDGRIALIRAMREERRPRLTRSSKAA